MGRERSARGHGSPTPSESRARLTRPAGCSAATMPASGLPTPGRRPAPVGRGAGPSALGDVGGGPGVAAGDPAGRHERRRGRPGRLAGERRLAAGGPRDGLRRGPRAGLAAAAARSEAELVEPPGRRTVDGRALDPESGALAPPAPDGPIGSAGRATGIRPRRRRTARWARRRAGRTPTARSVARASSPEPPPQPRGGSTVGMSRLGALARALRPDRRLPAPPQHPLRRDARDRRPAHRHRAARAGDDAGPGRRPVRQARRRDAQAHQARPARPRDARRDRRDAPAHRARLRRPASTSTASPRRSPRSSRCSRRPTRSASSRSRAGPRCRPCRSRGRRASTTSSSRSRSSGRARSRATPSTRTCAASRASSR